MTDKQREKFKCKIKGMHCTACEVTIERKFRALPGVSKARVNHHKGVAEIMGANLPKLHELQQAITDDGYQVYAWSEEYASRKRRKRDYAEAGAIFLLLMALSSVLIFFQFRLCRNDCFNKLSLRCVLKIKVRAFDSAIPAVDFCFEFEMYLNISCKAL